MIERTGTLPVPLAFRNPVTGLMKGLGYGGGYRYDHDVECAVCGQKGLPEELAGTRFYEPSPGGSSADSPIACGCWTAWGRPRILRTPLTRTDPRACPDHRGPDRSGPPPPGSARPAQIFFFFLKKNQTRPAQECDAQEPS